MQLWVGAHVVWMAQHQLPTHLPVAQRVLQTRRLVWMSAWAPFHMRRQAQIPLPALVLASVDLTRQRACQAASAHD